MYILKLRLQNAVDSGTPDPQLWTMYLKTNTKNVSNLWKSKYLWRVCKGLSMSWPVCEHTDYATTGLAKIPSYKRLPWGIWLDILSNQSPLVTPPIFLLSNASQHVKRFHFMIILCSSSSFQKAECDLCRTKIKVSMIAIPLLKRDLWRSKDEHHYVTGEIRQWHLPTLGLLKLSYETVGLNMHQEKVSLLMTGVRYIANAAGVRFGS